MLDKVYIVTAYDWEDVEIDKAFVSLRAAHQRAEHLNIISHLDLFWSVEDVEVGD